MSVSAQRARLDFRLPLEPSRLLRARHRIRDYLYEHDVRPEVIDALVLAIEEAMTNAVRHSGSAEDLEVRVAFEGRDVVAEIRDHGRGFDQSGLDLRTPPDLLQSGGRGLFLIGRLSDAMELRCDDGVCIRAVKRDALPGALAAVTRGLRAPLPGLYGQRDERQRTMLEEIPEMYAALDWEFCYIYVNEYFAAVTGRRRDDLVGASLWDVFPEILGTDVERRLRDAMELGLSSRYEFFFPPLESWFEQRIYPTSFGISQFSVPINERKRREAERDELVDALRESERRYRELVQNANSAIIRWSRDGSITFFNEYAERLFGWTAEEALGQPVSILLPERDSRGVDLTRLAQDILDHPAQHASSVNENIDRQGRRVWVSWTNKAIVDADGQVSEIFAVGSDITERAEAEALASSQNLVLGGITTILESALRAESEERLGEISLRVAEVLTDSPFGFLGQVGEDGLLRDIAISDPGWRQCAMPDQSGHAQQLSPFPLRGLYGHVLATGQSLLTNSPAEHPESIGLPEGHPSLTAFLGAPLKSSGRTVGIIAVGNREGGYLDEHRQRLEAIAPSIVEAFDRRRAEEALRRSTEVTTRLLHAAHTLRESLALDEVLDRLAHLVLEVGGHSRVAISLWDEKRGCLETVASLGEEPVRLGTCVSLSGLSAPAQRAVAERAATLIDYEELGEGQHGPAESVRSHLALDVPLFFRDRFVGLLATDDPGERREFTAQQIRLVEGLASHAVAAIADARLYEAQLRIATTLQEGFFHPLPAVPGWEFSAVTMPASDVERVGGDFHDVFSVADRFLGVLMGDVEGKGLAAAGLTETVRSAARVLAISAPAPGFVLEHINQLLVHDESALVTALFAAVHQTTGAFRIGVAGHPPPVVVHADGSADVLPVSPALPLGTFFDTAYPTETGLLAPGESLVLYTDGVTDARRQGRFFGEEGILRETGSSGPRSAGEIADGLAGALREWAGELRDDVHILVVRRLPPAGYKLVGG